MPRDEADNKYMPHKISTRQIPTRSLAVALGMVATIVLTFTAGQGRASAAPVGAGADRTAMAPVAEPPPLDPDPFAHLRLKDRSVTDIEIPMSTGCAASTLDLSGMRPLRSGKNICDFFKPPRPPWSQK